jgi:tetratricopeptide (TPR) repeat protein
MLILGCLLAILLALLVVLRRSAEPTTIRREAEELFHKGRAADALPLARQALRLAEASAGPDAFVVVPFLDTLATIHSALGQKADAEPILKRVLAIREKELGTENPALMVTLNSLGEIAQESGRHGDAEACCRRSVAIGNRILGRVPGEMLVALRGLGAACIAQGKAAEAGPVLDRAARLLKEDHADAAAFLDALAEQYVKMGQEDEAKKLRDRAVRIREDEAKKLLERGLKIRHRGVNP